MDILGAHFYGTRLAICHNLFQAKGCWQRPWMTEVDKKQRQQFSWTDGLEAVDVAYNGTML